MGTYLLEAGRAGAAEASAGRLRMHVVVNQQLVHNRVRLATVCHVIALGVFGVGLWVSWVEPEQILGSYAAIVVGLLLYNLGQVFLRRWGPRYRRDAVLAKALKGFDNRYTLLAFASTKLPDYILVGPGGVQVIVPRSHDGGVSCRRDRWAREGRRGVARLLSFFGGVPLGNPSADVSRGVQRVREKLQEHGLQGAQEPPVGGLVVFTNPGVKLRIDGCSYPVTGLKQLRSYVRSMRGTLGQPSLDQAVRALES